MMHRAMFYYCATNGQFIVEHADVEINYFWETALQLKECWQAIHPDISYQRVASFVRQRNRIFLMIKDRHLR